LEAPKGVVSRLENGE